MQRQASTERRAMPQNVTTPRRSGTKSESERQSRTASSKKSGMTTKKATVPPKKTLTRSVSSGANQSKTSYHNLF
ncbi:Hypp7193 [Branchiostoma lanceolatum]|uniref:Hypp7193 protein n=1 Tax=Branchiostoma lanceolatum TaxID=7740 RepID=A0A8J9YYL5_BRALA|nr:Hypp7193 [Branchiostoma lanceolatum]